MVSWWLVAAAWAVEPLEIPADTSLPPWSAPLEGALTKKDEHDVDGPWDWYVIDAPPGAWVDVTLTDFAFSPRVTVGDEREAYGPHKEPPATVSALASGPLRFGIGGNGSGGDDYGPYAFRVAVRAPPATEPPVGAIPTAVSLDTNARVVDGSFCHLVTVAPTSAGELQVSAKSDSVKPRVLVGRWVDGALVVDASRSAPPSQYWGGYSGAVTVRLEPGVRRVVGVCGDALGEVTVEHGTAQEMLAAHLAADGRTEGLPDVSPARAAEEIASAFAAKGLAVETTSQYLASTGSVRRPLPLPAGREVAFVVITNDHRAVPAVRLWVGECGPECVAWAGHHDLGVEQRADGAVLALGPSGYEQRYAEAHVEGWRLTWPASEGDRPLAAVEVSLDQPGEVRVVSGAP